MVLEEIVISKALILSDNEERTVQLILIPNGTSAYDFKIYSGNSNEEIKEMEKEKRISQDDEHRGYEEIQKTTDDFIKKIEELVQHKNNEIMEG